MSFSAAQRADLLAALAALLARVRALPVSPPPAKGTASLDWAEIVTAGGALTDVAGAAWRIDADHRVTKDGAPVNGWQGDLAACLWPHLYVRSVESLPHWYDCRTDTNSVTRLVGDPRPGQARPVRIGAVGFLTIAEAAKAAKDGDTVEIDAGDYPGAVAIWTQARLTIRSIGGTARIPAAGQNVEGKGTWLLRGGVISIDGVEFSGSRVADGNGAGLRIESGQVRLVRCRFIDNENGLLTGNDPDVKLTLEDCEFDRNGGGDGQTHNIYVGEIASLTVTGCWSHRAKIGHLLKSRAARSVIAYNRLTDEDGSASYELEFPAGGIASVYGNIIQQSPDTDNSTIVAFGAESLHWPSNELLLANNTLINGRPQGGVFLFANPGATVRVANNLLCGEGDQSAFAGNGNASFVGAQVADLASFDLRPRAVAGFVGTAALGVVAIDREYAHPAHTVPATWQANPGAYQSSAPSVDVPPVVVAPPPLLPAPNWYVKAAVRQWLNMGVAVEDPGCLAYSGVCINTVGIWDGNTFIRGTFPIFFGAGHAVSNNSAVYAFGPLESENPRRYQLSPSSNLDGSEPGVYKRNGIPIAPHTYNQTQFLPDRNWMVVGGFMAAGYIGNQNFGQVSFVFDFNVPDPMRNVAWRETGLLVTAAIESTSVYNATTKSVFEVGGTTRLMEFKPGALSAESCVWIPHNKLGASPDSTGAAIHPTDQLMFAPWYNGQDGALRLLMLDLRIPGATSWFDIRPANDTMPRNPRPGGGLYHASAAWVPSENAWSVFVDQGRKTIYWLDRPNKPFVDGGYVMREEMPIGGDTPPPGFPGAGIYGAFGHIPGACRSLYYVDPSAVLHLFKLPI